MTSIQLLRDRPSLQQAEELLRARVAEGADHSANRPLGYQDGQAEGARVHWHSRLGIWGCLDETDAPLEERFWNAFGTEDPRTPAGLSITCEVNPAREDINPRVAGAFAVDRDTGHRLLLHRGRIGGDRT